MPPRQQSKRKPGATTTGGTSSSSTARRKGASKLAKELKLSPEEEDEIREAFDMFVVDEEEGGPDSMDVDYQQEMGDVIETGNVRKAMLALGFETSRSELTEILDTLDPHKSGYVTWDSFVRLCALKMKYRDDQAELTRAYHLFTNGGEGPITIFDLKRIARELKENVDDSVLEDMLLEASGGLTVGLDEFEGVMKRAGVL